MTGFILKASCLASLCLGAPGLGVAAPVPPPAAAVDPARMAAAEKLLEAMHYDTMWDRTRETMIKQIERDMPAQINAKSDNPLPSDLIAKLQDIIATHFRKAVAEHRAEMKRATLLIYCEHFTAPELQRLAQIQTDPVMIKSQQEMPQIAAETMGLGHALVAEELPKIQEEAKALILNYLSQKREKSGT